MLPGGRASRERIHKSPGSEGNSPEQSESFNGGNHNEERRLIIIRRRYFCKVNVSINLSLRLKNWKVICPESASTSMAP